MGKVFYLPVFVFRFQRNKKPQTITIGKYPSILLGKARPKNIKNVFDPAIDLFTWLNLVIPLLKEEKHQKDLECRVVGAEIIHNGELCTPVCPKKLLFTHQDI